MLPDFDEVKVTSATAGPPVVFVRAHSEVKRVPMPPASVMTGSVRFEARSAGRARTKAASWLASEMTVA